MERISFLETIWNRWKQFGQLIGDVFARIVLTVLFFTVLVPFGIGVRLFGDPLRVKSENPGTCWTKYSGDAANLLLSRRQF